MPLIDMKDYCVLVVIYKTTLHECTSIQSLFCSAQYLLNSTVVIWDNSPNRLNQNEVDLLHQKIQDVHYIHTPQNIALSRIYNSVTEQFADYNFHVFLDQDSCFDESYFKEINKARATYHDLNLYVPKISHKGKLLSPGYFYSFKSSYRKRIIDGVNSTRNLCIITSGMCISSRYLRTVFPGFNEDLTFYCIDTYFAIQYRKTNQFFYVLDCRFDHSLSVNENEPYNIKWTRFKNHRDAMIILTKEANLFTWWMSKLYIIFLTVKFKLANVTIKSANGTS